jgi:hypothetical protein
MPQLTGGSPLATSRQRRHSPDVFARDEPRSSVSSSTTSIERPMRPGARMTTKTRATEHCPPIHADAVTCRSPVAGPARRPASATSCATSRTRQDSPPLRAHQLRHARAIEMSREGVPLLVIRHQPGVPSSGFTSAYLHEIDNTEINQRPVPMIPAASSLERPPDRYEPCEQDASLSDRCPPARRRAPPRRQPADCIVEVDVIDEADVAVGRGLRGCRDGHAACGGRRTKAMARVAEIASEQAATAPHCEVDERLRL